MLRATECLESGLYERTYMTDRDSFCQSICGDTVCSTTFLSRALRSWGRPCGVTSVWSSLSCRTPLPQNPPQPHPGTRLPQRHPYPEPSAFTLTKRTWVGWHQPNSMTPTSTTHSCHGENLVYLSSNKSYEKHRVGSCSPFSTGGHFPKASDWGASHAQCLCTASCLEFGGLDPQGRGFELVWQPRSLTGWGWHSWPVWMPQKGQTKGLVEAQRNALHIHSHLVFFRVARGKEALPSPSDDCTAFFSPMLSMHCKKALGDGLCCEITWWRQSFPNINPGSSSQCNLLRQYLASRINC